MKSPVGGGVCVGAGTYGVVVRTPAREFGTSYSEATTAWTPDVCPMMVAPCANTGNVPGPLKRTVFIASALLDMYGEDGPAATAVLEPSLFWTTLFTVKPRSLSTVAGSAGALPGMGQSVIV